jgi:CBS domain-containing protein
MPKIETQNVITGFKVKDAMRRETARCAPDTPIDRAIARMVKHKSNALLIEDAGHHDERGIVSKTDLLAAYCAALPLSSPVGDMRNGPLLTCLKEDPLETALEIMVRNDVRRVYVEENNGEAMCGVLGHFDIAGLLYRICRQCRRGARGVSEAGRSLPLFVKDVMTPSPVSHEMNAPLLEVIDTLVSQHFGAVLIVDQGGRPQGVLSKTDLILAYRHGLEPDRAAKEVMTESIITASEDDPLALAIKRMIVADVQRLFVLGADSREIAGVLSLTDASRTRSGSCKACRAARLSV